MNQFCHSERSEESLFGFPRRKEREIPRSARNDKINLRLEAQSTCGSHIAGGAAGGWNVTFHRVVHHHAVGVESPSECADGALHALDPASRQAVPIAMIEKRNNFLAQNAIQILSIALIVHVHVGMRP